MTAKTAARGRTFWGRVGSPTLAAWLLLVAGIGISMVVAQVWRSTVHTQEEQSFKAEAASVGATLTSALRRMDDLTVAVRTLMGENPELTNPELAAWYREMGAQQRYPGVLGFGYVELVRKSALERYAAAVRADPVPGLPRLGKKLMIVPAGDRPSYCLIRLGLAGSFGRLVPGGLSVDLCAIRGILASPASGRVTAVTATLGALSQFLVVTAPVYRGGGVPATVAARERGTIGWVATLYDVKSILGNAVAGDPRLWVSVTRRNSSTNTTAVAGAPTGVGRLLPVASAGKPPKGSAFTRRFALSADGEWVVTVSKRANTGWLTAMWQGIFVLGVGTLLSLLVFLLAHVLARGRERALRMVAEKTEELRRQALHDALTGLPNRTLILDRAERTLTRARRGYSEVVILFIDLDNFKGVNDTFGHATGDKLLRAVSARISASLRESDSVGRLGGDEFVVLTETEGVGEHGEQLGQRLLELLREPYDFDGLVAPLTTTASIGIASGQRASADDLLRDADIALYEAKSAGKNRYAIFNPAMSTALEKRLSLDSGLRTVT